MSLIGRALARLAHRISGQLMLELPDDLQPTFVARLLEGANVEIAADPSFALFVHGQRQDVASISPRVDFRELAMYRQGSHMAVAFASDNRGMSTYSSVYPLLLSNGFPSGNTASGGTGVAGLQEFAACLAEVLAENVGTHGLSREEFQKTTQNILGFLAAAYEAVGNGQSSFAADWWLHVHQWVESLALPSATFEPKGVARLYGCAGLPVPSRGHALSTRPKEYIKVLQDRWSSPPAIMTEIARLEGLASAAKAAQFLAKLDWEKSHSITSLRSDSVVALVATANGGDPLDRIRGWGHLDEAVFKESFVDAKGKLGVRREGSDLPLPWKNALPVLVAKADESRDESGNSLLLRQIELVVPYKPDGEGSSTNTDASKLLSQVQVSGIRGCAAAFEGESSLLLPDGLHLKGALALTPAKKARNLAWIEVSTSSEAAQILVDRCSGSFTLLRSDEAALWAKPQGRSTKASLRGPIIWSRRDSDAASVEVPELGAYDLAVAWGESAGFDGKTATVRATPFSLAWAGMEDAGAKATVEITEGVDIRSTSQVIFHIDLFSSNERPLSPIIAAAHGLHPDASFLAEEDAFNYFEAQVGDCLANLERGHALGCILATSSRQKSDLVANGNGVRCTPDLLSRTGNDLSPGFPSQQLLSHPSYVGLLEAYVSLGIPKVIADLEKEEDSAGLTISRIALDFIPKETMDGLLKAYRELLVATSGLSPSDRFWARNPFSLVVYEEGSGYQSAQAVLLSPLHPIRLAWAWGLQIGLREAHDDGARPTESLALLDGTHFPSSVVFSDQFDSPSALMPVPVDPRPNDLYLGWHASVAIVRRQAAIPEWIAGRRFPVDGLSALSASSVSAAIDDFLRVSPHVQSLHIDLATTNPSRRSSSIDDGVLAKLGELAFGSSGLDGVAGVRVTDSETRLGPIPRFSGIDDAIAIARPGFNVQWVSTPPGQSLNSHVTFLEGNAALLAMEPTTGRGRGWLPSLPLRRTPIRSREATFTSLDYTLAEPDEAGREFTKVLHSYESATTGSHALKIIPNPVGVAGRPGWLVAGDFGVDPQVISRAARDQSNSDYILWDWRPATTIKPNRDTSSRAQPYFVLASVPPALNNAIHARLKQLNSQLAAGDVEKRAELLVSTLAERAIGLNTLLAIGHHQATGALGFFFALRSIGTWLDSAPSGEIRLVIPVDAVDPFLRASINSAGDGSRKRADLLAVRAFIGAGQRPCVVLVPVEIKHYGLGNGEREQAFPLAGEPRLNEHAEQLASYQSQLQSLCETYRDAAGSQASLLGQRLAAVLDAAIQLGSGNPESAGSLLDSVASGRADVGLGKGVLLWYQARASSIDGSKASWDEISGAVANRRNDVRVDPAALDACFWSGEDGLAHEVVREALDDASSAEVGTPTMEAEGDSASDAQEGQSAPEVESAPASAPPSDIPSDGGGEPISESPHAVSVGMGGKEESANAEPLPSIPISKPQRNKMAAVELERRYGALLAALSEFNVKVERPRGEVPYQEGPAFIEYAVFPSYGVSVNKIESQLENLKLRLKLSSDAEIGCSTHKGNVLLTVPKADDERYFVDAEDLWSRWQRPLSGFKVPVGEDASGDIVEIDLSNSNSPHLLIAGVTGSGKSEALLTILHGAARFYSPEELRLRLIDPKQTELNTLAGLQHTDGAIGWSGEEAIVLLDQAVEEMERRYKTFREAGANIRNISEYQASIAPMPRWIIVLDEYADLISDDDERKRIEKCLQRLSQKARAAGIHVIVSTQKPVVQVVNTVVKGNLPGKIALRVNTAMESRVILDESGAEKLVGKGDAIIRAGNGKARIQFARYAI
ncbi:FtsK/SpoIIIE domain-containing protein [Lysobacter arvi]|uniref:FtsK/SpoIIIE domain-containing protein n=1 Tax=Lysobacter arvi TaxID=3038776 RepID=A0ABU1CH28_9GAMM|nr:FtsK/SpoIIIE domain-containing protein [Lysobacter arvi]MDR0184260.1 FtsK/SpoIIIE domain-containing protein [Lysobacter arvi]